MSDRELWAGNTVAMLERAEMADHLVRLGAAVADLSSNLLEMSALLKRMSGAVDGLYARVAVLESKQETGQ